MMIRLFQLFILIFGLFGSIYSICDTLAQLDVNCGKKISFFGNRDLKPNTNNEIFDTNCKIYENGVNCLIEYSNKCLEEKPAAMAKSLMKSIKKHYDKRCRDPDYGPEFIEHNKCFGDPAIFEQFHQCADKWYYHMQNLNSLRLDVEKGIQTTCCLHYEFSNCIRERNRELCHDKNMRFWDEALDDVADETIEMFCANLKSSEECSKNYPADLWSKITDPVSKMDANALRARTGKFKSMVISILDMISQYQLNG